MHEWHTEKGKNILHLINSFMGFEFTTDYGGHQKVTNIGFIDRIFTNEDDALNKVTNSSYGGNTAYITAFTSKKVTKAYQSAYDNFLVKYKEYKDFKRALNVGYGRKSLRVTCPTCDSSITLKYGGIFKACPVCGSKKIISDSNWNTLETKRKMVEKAAENLAKEAEKNEVTFICGIEWHC